jgi:nitrate/nitrite-specific signal transduction histidine kinase
MSSVRLSYLSNPDTNRGPAQARATSISQVVGLWDGSMNVSVSVDQNASAILRHDSHAAATAIEVISEATVNAAKHASTSAVSATITAEGRRLRVAVINKRDLVDVSTNPVRSTFTGLAFLRELTSELRLESSESSTTLFAEIPSRVELDEFASGENATVSTFGVDPDAR